MANVWVIRRHDGLFWQRGCGYGPLESARAYDQKEVRQIGPAALGLEWVELDDAVQQVEAAKAVRMWVAKRIADGCYYTATAETWDPCLLTAYRWPTPSVRFEGLVANVPVLVHPDGTVTLDEPAPAPPSPYSESADAPIALVPIDDVQLVAQLSEKIGKAYYRLARLTARVGQWERERDEAAARLRGGK